MYTRLWKHLSKGNYGKSIISDNSNDQYNYVGNYIYLFGTDYQRFNVSYENVDIDGILEVVDNYCDC